MFFDATTFTGKIKTMLTILWGTVIVAAIFWFVIPTGWQAIPARNRKPIERPFKKMMPVTVLPVMATIGKTLKIIGGIVFVLAPVVTGGTIYILANTRRWQRIGNIELAETGTVYWIAVPMNDKTKWQNAADMWLRLRPPLLRPDNAIMRGRGVHASFEVIAIENDGIYWLMWSPDPRKLSGKRQDNQDLPGTLGAALSGYNPKVRVTKRNQDPVGEVMTGDRVQVSWIEVSLSGASQYPIKTDFQGDPMMTLVSNMHTDQNVQAVGMQVIVRPVGNWQAPGRQELGKLIAAQSETGIRTMTKAQKEQRLLLESKLDRFGFETVIRFYAIGRDVQSLGYRLRAIQDSLGQYRGMNGFVISGRGQDAETLLNRSFTPRFDPRNVLNAGELSVIYHMPSVDWEAIPGIKWSPSRVVPPSAGVIRGWGMPEHLQQKGAA